MQANVFYSAVADNSGSINTTSEGTILSRAAADRPSSVMITKVSLYLTGPRFLVRSATRILCPEEGIRSYTITDL